MAEQTQTLHGLTIEQWADKARKLHRRAQVAEGKEDSFHHDFKMWCNVYGYSLHARKGEKPDLEDLSENGRIYLGQQIAKARVAEEQQKALQRKQAKQLARINSALKGEDVPRNEISDRSGIDRETVDKVLDAAKTFYDDLPRRTQTQYDYMWVFRNLYLRCLNLIPGTERIMKQSKGAIQAQSQDWMGVVLGHDQMRVRTKWSFDEQHIGLSSEDGQSLETRVIPRLSASKADWYRQAKEVCNALNHLCSEDAVKQNG